MLGFMTFSRTPPISSIRISNPIPKQQIRFPSYRSNDISCLKPRRKNPRGFRASFSENKEELSEKPNGGNDDEEEEDMKKKGGGDEKPRFNLKWSELLLDPDPDNVVAVGLTGVLAWASVQLHDHFDSKNLGNLHQFLGVVVISVININFYLKALINLTLDKSSTNVDSTSFHVVFQETSIFSNYSSIHIICTYLLQYRHDPPSTHWQALNNCCVT